MVENLIPPTSPSEAGENTEGSQAQNLETATVEPQAFVEQTGNYRQSEAIQSALAAVVNNVAATQIRDTVEVLPNPLPHLAEQGASTGGGGDTVEVLPTPLPHLAEQGASTGSGGDTVEVVPNPLPHLAEQGASAGSGGDTVEVLPNPLPHLAEQGASTGSGGDTVEVLPNPLPHLAEQGASTGGGGDTVEVLPDPLPHLAEQGASTGGGGDTVEVLPNPLPHQAERGASTGGGGDTVEVLPDPLPHLAERGASTGGGGDTVEVLPNPLPHQAERGASTGGGGDTVEVLPNPLPHLAERGASMGGGGDTLSTTALKGDESLINRQVQIPEGLIDPALSGGGRAGMSVFITPENDKTAKAAARESPTDMNQVYKPLEAFIQEGNGELKYAKDVRLQELSEKEKSSEQEIKQKIREIDANVADAEAAGMSGALFPTTVVGGSVVRAQSGGIEQAINASTNVDLSAFTGSVEVLAVHSVRESKTDQPSRFENREALPGQEGGNPAPVTATGPSLEDKEPQLNGSNRPRDGEEGLRSPGAYVEVTKDGLVLVDANGNPLSKQLQIDQHKDANGNFYYTVWVPDALGGAEVQIPLFTRSEPVGYIKGTPQGYILVDANGTEIGGPAAVSSYTDAQGNKHFLLTLPDGKQVEVTEYFPSLPNTYAHVGPDGQVVLVDANGNPLPDQTKVTQYKDNNGVVHYEVWIPGGTPAEVPSYTPTLTDHYIKITSHGVLLVDGNGWELPGNDQTQIVVHKDANGNIYYTFLVPDALGGAEVKASIYSGSEQIGYVKDTPQGITLVDANGTPTNYQPGITSYTDAQGNKHYLASLPDGNGNTIQVEIPLYSPSLPNTYAHVNPDGQIVLVDANGKSLDTQPKVTHYTDKDGVVHYEVWIPGGTPAEVPQYTPTLPDRFILVLPNGVRLVDGLGYPFVDQAPLVMHIDANGKIYYTAFIPDAQGGTDYIVPLIDPYKAVGYVKETPQGFVLVDANGTPTAYQPGITSYTDAQGNKHYLLSMPGQMNSVQVEAPRYSPSLPNTYAHVNPDGQIILVDANANPLPVQTKVTQYTDKDGVVHYEVWIPGGTPAEVPPYTPSLSDWLHKPI